MSVMKKKSPEDPRIIRAPYLSTRSESGDSNPSWWLPKQPASLLRRCHLDG